MKIIENEQLLVRNKKSGIPVFPKHNDPSHPCVLFEVKEYAPYLNEINVDRFECGIAHRLDIPTSGAFYIAKNTEYLNTLRSLFTSKQLLKTYYFLSSQSKIDRISCDLPIGHHPKNKRKMLVKKNKTYRCRGKWYLAQTFFQLIGSRGGKYLYRATMRSGIMHQIRVHASFCGLSLDGDSLYGSQKLAPISTGFALHHFGIEHTALPKMDNFLPKNWPEWTHKLI